MTTVYWKPIFSGVFTNFESFVPKSYNVKISCSPCYTEHLTFAQTLKVQNLSKTNLSKLYLYELGMKLSKFLKTPLKSGLQQTEVANYFDVKKR